MKLFEINFKKQKKIKEKLRNFDLSQKFRKIENCVIKFYILYFKIKH